MFRKKNRQKEHSIEDWITFEESDGNSTLRLSGELGYFTVPLLEDTLRKLLASRKNTSLSVDLSAVSAIVDSRIISIFIQAHRRAQKRGIQLKLLRANSVVTHVFESVKASETLFAD